MVDRNHHPSEGTDGVTAEGGEAGREVAAAQPVHPSVVAVQERFGDAILRHEVVAGDEHVVYVEPSRCFEVLRWLKENPDHLFDYLSDVTAVDYGSGRPIQVVYQLYSIPLRRALRVKAELPLSGLEIESVVSLWQAANWLEREVFDMFGVTFLNHPDLRRILMPHNYAEGHPLRKDFPLRGRFSRAEQTRRALAQEPEDHYISTEFQPGRDPQVVRWPETGGKPVPVRKERAAGTGGAAEREGPRHRETESPHDAESPAPDPGPGDSHDERA
jgi:NADH-quinone oxidoreductase subunit C